MTTWLDADDVALACGGPEADPDDYEGAAALASRILYELTGQRWPGPTPDVVRPCSPLYSSGTTGGSHYPPGAWTGWGSGWCGCSHPSVCNCATPSAVTLPGRPVISVERVTLDAVVLDPLTYRVVDQLLVRTTGESWPCCQDYTVAGDQPGAFEVRYTWGELPDAAGIHAATVLACELHRAETSDGACRLPKRVTTITRQGVSFAMLDPMAMFPDGMTGIPEVDLWLGSLRYGNAHRPSLVMIPGSRPRNLRDVPRPVGP